MNDVAYALKLLMRLIKKLSDGDTVPAEDLAELEETIALICCRQ